MGVEVIKNFLNLTPNRIAVKLEQDDIVIISPSGMVAQPKGPSVEPCEDIKIGDTTIPVNSGITGVEIVEGTDPDPLVFPPLGYEDHILVVNAVAGANLSIEQRAECRVLGVRVVGPDTGVGSAVWNEEEEWRMVAVRGFVDYL